MGDDLDRLPDAIVHSQRALRVMRQNVTVALASNAVFVILAPLGYVTLVLAVAADMGISLLVTLNGLRLLGRKRAAAAAAEQQAVTTERADGCGATSATATSASLPVVAPSEPRGATGRPTANATPTWPQGDERARSIAARRPRLPRSRQPLPTRTAATGVVYRRRTRSPTSPPDRPSRRRSHATSKRRCNRDDAP